MVIIDFETRSRVDMENENKKLQADVDKYRDALKDIYSVTNDLQVMSIVMANLPAPTTVPPAEPTTGKD